PAVTRRRTVIAEYFCARTCLLPEIGAATCRARETNPSPPAREPARRPDLRRAAQSAQPRAASVDTRRHRFELLAQQLELRDGIFLFVARRFVAHVGNDDDHDAPVLRAAGFRVVARDRLVFTVTD